MISLIKSFCENWYGRISLLAITAIFFCIGITIWQIWDSRFLLSGTVVRKDFHPGWVQMIQSGDTYTPIFHSPHWSVTIEGIDSRGQLKRKAIDVGPYEFDKISIGQQYPKAEQE